MKEIDAAIDALEAALSDDQPYIDRCNAALAGLRSLKREPFAYLRQTSSEKNPPHGWAVHFAHKAGDVPLYAHPAPVNQQLLEALKLAEDSLGAFVSDHGWSQQDMDNLDTVTAAIAQAEKEMK